MRRKAGAVSAVLALASACLVLLAPPVSAQTAYPPGVCTVTLGSQELGAFNVGSTFRFTLAPPCVFQPGVAVSLNVNGVAIPGKFADANGFVSVQISVLSETTLAIDDPVNVPAVCGRNSASVTGFSRVANANVTQTGFFTVICPGVQPKVTPGRVAFTGANIIRWSLLALGAMLVGLLLVTSTRRRRAGRSDDERAQELTRS